MSLAERKMILNAVYAREANYTPKAVILSCGCKTSFRSPPKKGDEIYCIRCEQGVTVK